MITFTKTTMQDARELIEEYIAGLPDLNDDFWEMQILDSNLYCIGQDGGTVGLAAVQPGGGALTLFWLRESVLRCAQAIFAQLIRELKPGFAYAATNDELLLALCMEREKGIALQARFFREGSVAVRPAEYHRTLLRPATMEDAPDLLDEDVEEKIRQGKYFVLRQDGEFLGQGFFNQSVLWPGAASIGMSVHPEHRRKNVGRSIILHLKDICHERGIIPVCGCWYFNTASWSTLQSAGFVSKTRLLKIWLDDKEKQFKG